MNTLIALALVVTGTLNIDGVDHDIRIAPSQPPVVEQPVPPVAPPPPPVAPPPVADAGFCDAPGVVLCSTFDSEADLAAGEVHGAPIANRQWERRAWIDTEVKASGAGSLRFDVPPLTGPNSSGQWIAPLAQPLTAGKSMTLEFKVLMPPGFNDSALVRGQDVKLFVLYHDKQCAATEIAMQVERNSSIPYLYTQCGHGPGTNYIPAHLAPQLATIRSNGAGGFPLDLSFIQQGPANAQDVVDAWIARTLTDADVLPGGRFAGWCSYNMNQNLTRTGRTCLRGAIEPGQWTQIRIQVDLHAWGRHPDLTLGKFLGADPRNRVQMWVGPVGGELEQISDSHYSMLLGSDEAPFSRITITPYRTNKDPTANHPPMSVWYDDFRVTMRDI